VDIARAAGNFGIGVQVTGSHARVYRTAVTGIRTGFLISGANTRIIYALADTCERGYESQAQGTYLLYCVAKNITNTFGGFYANTGGFTLVGCVVAGGLKGYNLDIASTLLNCIAYGMTGSNGQGFDVGTISGSSSVLINCIAYNNSQEGFKTAGVSAIHASLNNCAGGGNSINYNSDNWTDGVITGFISLTENPFTDPEGLDFTLNDLPGGGTLLKGLGWPSALPGLTGTNYPSVGVYTPNPGGGGGSGITSIARLNGVLIGTDDITGVTINGKETVVSNEVDILQDNTSSGTISLFLSYTTPTGNLYGGKIEVQLDDGRVSGKLYANPAKKWSFRLSESAGTRRQVFVGRVPASRFMKATLTNTSNVQLTDVSLLYILEKTA
jgi:hypothetical protein